MASLKVSTTNKGFTLIEILVVIGLLAILGSFTLIASVESFRGSSFRNERDSLVSLLYKARSQAVNNICLGVGGSCTDGAPHGVHIQSGQYTLFQGSSYATRDVVADQIIKPSYAVTVDPSSATDVVFEQLSGDATTTPFNNWVITLVDTTSKTSTITLNSEGQIIWSN